MTNDLDDVIRHAVMANHDSELSSVVVLMVSKNKEPELHMAIHSDDVHAMNSVADLFKVEMLKLLNCRAENRKQRE